MKHLRKFNESVSNEYYQELDTDLLEWHKNLCDPLCVGYKKAISIDKNIVNSFRERLNNTKDIVWEAYNNIDKLWDFNFILIYKIHQKLGKNIGSSLGIWNVDRIKIYETQDEWFWVEMSGGRSKSNMYQNTFFKCDQIDGVKKLLQDLGVIK